MEDVLKKLGKTMHVTKLSKGQLVLLIAEMSGGVSRQTVYNWIKSEDVTYHARIEACLEEIERDYKAFHSSIDTESQV